VGAEFGVEFRFHIVAAEQGAEAEEKVGEHEAFPKSGTGLRGRSGGTLPLHFDRNDTASFVKVQDEWNLFPFQPEKAGATPAIPCLAAIRSAGR
jgi:hypothetical protein